MENPVSEEGKSDLLEALEIVWRQKAVDLEQEKRRVLHQQNSLRLSISQQVEAATDPSNATIKDEILSSIAKKKEEVQELEGELGRMSNDAKEDKEKFLQFAFDFVDDMGTKFLEISSENRTRCKLIIFPAGFYWNAENKVYTPEISPLIRLAGNKKDAHASNKSLLVQHS